MEILKEITKVKDLRIMAARIFENLLKAVVDVDRELVAVDAELHSDLEALFLENGSQQKSLWGINFYPDQQGDDFVEFDSMINMRPSQGNMSPGIDSEATRKKILKVIDKWVKK